MSLRNRSVLILVVAAMAVLAGCSSSAHNPVPPPSGGFGNTDLSGTYTFAVSGSDANGIFTMAGSLVACGCSAGTISSGTVDLVDSSPLVAPGSTIGSNSVYSVSSDGRGLAKLMITTTGGAVEVDIDFVLTSNTHGLIIRYDGNGTGSGTIDLQTSLVTLANTNYAFMLTGSDFSNPPLPLATAGAFTLNLVGAITGGTGVEDFNYNTVPSASLPLTGSVLVGAGTAPGSASLLTSFHATPLTFDVYAIDSTPTSTHLKLIENDGVAILVGDVFTQPSAAIPMANLVFTMSNLDTNGNLVAMGGVMSSDGVSKITTGSEDVNDAGIVDGGGIPAVPYSFTGTFLASGGGRFLLSLNTPFVGGTMFAAYPSGGGLLMLEVDSGLGAGVTSGVALTQAATPTLTTSQGYGLNLTGEDVTAGAELDEIAEFQTTTSTFTNGLLDENDGGPASPQNFSGTYTVNASGSGSATLTSGLSSMFFYVVDSSTVLFISTDTGQAALGSFELQTTPQAAAIASPAAQPRSLPMLRSIPHGRLASRQSKTGFGHAK